jgi:hypothetical protein
VDQYRDEAYFGLLGHPGPGPVSFVISTPRISYNRDLEILDYILALGPLNMGNVYGPNGANLNWDKSFGGTAFPGLNYDDDLTGKNTGVTTDAAITAGFGVLAYQDGAGGWTIGSPTQSVDPNFYDNGSGTLAAVSNNKWTVQRIFWRASVAATAIYYGQVQYNSKEGAIASRQDPVVHNQDLDDSLLTFRGWLVVKKGANNLSDPTLACFINAGRFGLV